MTCLRPYLSVFDVSNAQQCASCIWCGRPPFENGFELCDQVQSRHSAHTTECRDCTWSRNSKPFSNGGRSLHVTHVFHPLVTQMSHILMQRGPVCGSLVISRTSLGGSRCILLALDISRWLSLYLDISR